MWGGTSSGTNSIKRKYPRGRTLCPYSAAGACTRYTARTIVTQSRFEVTMTQSSREQFLKDIITSAPTGSVDKILATKTKSECFKAKDRARIFEI